MEKKGENRMEKKWQKHVNIVKIGVGDVSRVRKKTKKKMKKDERRTRVSNQNLFLSDFPLAA